MCSLVCLKIFVDIFDIFWDVNVLKQKIIFMFDVIGGMVNCMLYIYLMEGGKLCDGSKFDNCGVYCCFVLLGIMFNVLGCDQLSVMISVVDYLIIDVEFYDINVVVNICNIGFGQFMLICSFQYIIDEFQGGWVFGEDLC